MFTCNWGGMHGFQGDPWAAGCSACCGRSCPLALFIYLGARLFLYISRGNDGRRDREDSLEILRDKYALGEVGSEEYQRIKDFLAR